jgi:hypothetical protein
MYDRPVRRLLAILTVVHATGCDRLLNLDHIDPAAPGDGRAVDDVTDMAGDAFVPSDCSLVPFSTTPPAGVPELQGQVAGDPAVTEDSREIYFVRSGISPFEIWRADRLNATDPFAIDVAPMPFNISGNENADPSLTADGELLVFISHAGSDPKLGYQVTRSAGSEWSSPAQIPGLEVEVMVSVSISWDGLTIYYSRPDLTLMQAARAARTDPFGSPVAVADPQTVWPTVSADGLEIFYSSQSAGIYHGRRTATNKMFGTITMPLDFGADPYLMHTSTTLWLTYQSEQTVAKLERVCP